MSSVDNRIVILTFDNKDFEKNVSTSMDTLDKLKNNLDLSKSAKGLTALSASAKSFDLGPMGRAIESIKDRFSGLGIVGMTVLQNLTNTAVDFGKRLVSATIGPLTSGGWKRALNIEQATFQMEGLLGKAEDGAEKIKAIMESVKTSVQGTAYGMDEAARVASQLVATGVEDADTMLTYLQGIAGAAAMTGSSYDEVGRIFTTVAGNGRLMGDQLIQFATRGLNIAATLSKQMGITEAEFRDLVSKGQISFDQFAAGLAEAFGEHATKANETFTGSLSNMRAALARIGEEVATPALKYFRDIFYSLKLLIDAVHERLKPLIKLFNEFATKNAAKFVDFIDSITEALGGESQRMKKAAEEAADATEETAARVTKSSEEIEEAARRVIAGEFGNGEERRRQLEELGLSYERVQNKVNELSNCEYRYEVQEEDVGEAVKETAKQTDEAARAMDDLKEKTKAWQGFLAKNAWYNFVAALKNIGGAIKGFGGAGVGAFKEFFTSETGTKFLEGIQGISRHFNSFTRELSLNEQQAQGLKNIFKGLFWVLEQGAKGLGKIVDFGITIAGGVVGLGKRFLGFLGTIDLFNGKIDETTRKGQFILALQGVFEKLGNSFTVLKSKVKLAFEAFKKTDAFKNLKENAEKLWGILRELGGKVLETVTDKLKKFVDSDYLPSFDKIMGWFEKGAGYLSKFIGWCADGIPKVKDFFKAFRDSETGKFGKFADFLIKAKDAIKEFFSGVNTETGELNLFGKLKEAISKAMDNLGEFFSGIKTEGFVEGFKTFISNVSEAISNIDPELLEKIKIIGGMILGLGVLVAATKTLRSITDFFNAVSDMTDVFGIKAFANAYKERTKMMKIGLLIAGIATIIGSIWVLSTIEPEKLLHSLEAIGLIMGALVSIYLIIGKVKVNDAAMRNFALSMAGLGIGLLAITGAAKILSGMTWSEILDSAEKVALFAGIMAIAARVAGSSKAGLSFLGLALAINLLIPAILILGRLKHATINKAAKAIAIVALELAIAARIAGSVKAAAAFMGLAVAIDLLVPALIILGKCKWETIKQGATAIGIIAAELAIASRIAASENSGKGALSILAMAATIATAAVSLKVLSELDAEGLKRGATALGVVIGETALIMGVAQGCKNSWASLLAMAGVIAAAAIALVVLAKQDWENMKQGMISLGLIMTSAGTAVKKAGSNGGLTAIASAAAMAIAIGSAVLALYFLKDTPWEQLLAGSAALSMLIISVGGALKLMSGIGIPGALLGAVALGLSIDIVVGLVGAFIFGVGKLAELIDDKLDTGMVDTIRAGGEVIAEVGNVIGEFVGNIVSSFGTAATSGLSDIADNISAFAEHLGPFFEKIKEYGNGDLVSTVGNFAKALIEITAAEVLDALATPFVGNSSLETFGNDLVTFAEYFNKFAEQVSGIEYSDITKMHSVAGAIEVLGDAAKHIPNQETDKHWNLLSLIVGDNDLGLFGQELAEFAPNFETFANTIAGMGDIDSEKIEAVAAAVERMSTAASEIPNMETDKHWNLASLIFGDNDLSTFGEEMENFAGHFETFCENIDKIENIDTEKIETIASVIERMSQAAAEIQNQGDSLMSLIFGDNTLTTFGGELAGFTGPFADFVSDLEAMGDIDFEKISSIATAISDLGKASKLIPRDQDGSLLGFIVGKEGELGDFGEQLATFSEKFKIFSDNTKEMTIIRAGTISKVITTFADIADQLTATNLGNLTSLGTGLGELSSYMPTFDSAVDEINIGKIKSFTDALTGLVTALNSLNEDTSGALDKLSTMLSGSGASGIEEFTSSIGDGIDSMSSAVGDAFGKVASQITGLGGMSDLFTAMKTAGEDTVKEFTTAIDNKSKDAKTAVENLAKAAKNGIPSDLNTKFQTSGTKAATSFTGAINGRNTTAHSAGSGLASSAYNGLTSGANSGDWTTVGVNCARGFANGLSSSGSIATIVASARALAEAAINTAKRVLAQNSPSKVFVDIGSGVVEGFVKGIDDNLNDIVDMSETLANTTIKTAEEQVRRIQDAFETNAEISPVITPVIDLTNVTSGADQINSMFGRTQLGLNFANPALMNNLAYMSSSIGNDGTGNTDVVNAINGLKGGLNNNVTFNITVDGTESPEDFADRLVRSLKGYSKTRI